MSIRIGALLRLGPTPIFFDCYRFRMTSRRIAKFVTARLLDFAENCEEGHDAWIC
jgi:hypothetical protein